MTPPFLAQLPPSARGAAGGAACVAACVALGVALSVAAASPARAQGESGFVMPFTAVFISAGKLQMDVSKLNPRFERTDLLQLNPPQRTGFDAISNSGYSIGIGGYTPFGRVLLGAEGSYSDIGEESSPSGKTNRLETYYAMATVGFAAWTSWRFTLYPFIGVGAGNVKLTLRDRFGVVPAPLTQDPSFDEIVLSNATVSTVNGSYVIVQPGLGFDYLALHDNQSHVGLVLGLRFSTAISPNRTTWTYQGRSVYGAPDAAPSGAMLRLMVGIGGFRLAK
ncbi:MAG: outer membrane protein [Gemmatimonadales bacterium]